MITAAEGSKGDSIVEIPGSITDYVKHYYSKLELSLTKTGFLLLV